MINVLCYKTLVSTTHGRIYKSRRETINLNKEFQLPDVRQSVSNSEDFFEYVIKIHETLADKSPVQIYTIKIQNSVKFKIKCRYYLELLTSKTMKLLESSGQKVTEDKNGENVMQIKITELVLVHCNIVNNQCQHDSRILSIVVPINSFMQLLNIAPTNHIYTGTFHSEFSYIKVLFSDQTSILLEIVDR